MALLDGTSLALDWL